MKLLITLSRFPLPARKGDKLRAWQQIRGLAEYFEIYLLCLADEVPEPDEIREVQKYVKKLDIMYIPLWKRALTFIPAIFSGIPFQVAYFTSRKFKNKVENILRTEDIPLCYVQLIRLGKSIPYLPEVKYFLDYMDALSGGMQNRVPESKGIKKWLFAHEADRLRKYEAEIGKHFQACSIITAADAALLPASIQNKLSVIANGVDESFFEYHHAENTNKKTDIIFTGNMGYFPNIKAAEYLVQEILPLLKKTCPQIRICLAGTHPGEAVLKLAGPHVEVSGFVENMASKMCEARLYVAPLFTGSGLQNKLLESMATGMPVITSPLANDALGAEPGNEICICKTPEEYADKILHYLNEGQNQAKEMGLRGKDFVSRKYRWKASNQILVDRLKNLLR